MHYFMAQTKNAVIKAKDVPDLSAVMDMSEMFSDALKMNSDINNWDVSNVTNMQKMFSGAAAFNRPLNKWNTSNVTNTKISIGRECNLYYNHRTDPWKYPQESDYYKFFIR